MEAASRAAMNRFAFLLSVRGSLPFHFAVCPPKNQQEAVSVLLLRRHCGSSSHHLSRAIVPAPHPPPAGLHRLLHSASLAPCPPTLRAWQLAPSHALRPWSWHSALRLAGRCATTTC